MTDQDDPLEVIDKFLGALRSELAANPEMTYRIIKALPVSVRFDAAETVGFVNPLELISQNGPQQAHQMLLAFQPADLKKMAQRVNLASSADMARMSVDDLAALIVERGSRKISERSS